MPEDVVSESPRYSDSNKESGAQKDLAQRIGNLQKILTDVSPELRNLLLSGQHDAQSIISLLLGLKPACLPDSEGVNRFKELMSISESISIERKWIYDRELVKAKMGEYLSEFPGYDPMATQGKADEYADSLLHDLSFRVGTEPDRILALNFLHPLGIKTSYITVERQVGLLLGFPYEAVEYYTRGKGKEVESFNKYGFVFAFPKGSQEVAQFSSKLDEVYQKVYTAIPELKHGSS